MTPQERKVSKVLVDLLDAFEQATFRAQPRDPQQRDAWATSKIHARDLVDELRGRSHLKSA